ncbi:hypothetical protein Ais01nite_56420 [Asanoa ishikariensis]|uniref:Uncharacterized protein n=1 Tax=Asanoa ishikariensis TaxID=137265 RepID=A0A1H3TWT5_9ACTN|nr:hypothetical protein [Asanoa ishikariensis]GIF67607.1 hypothetical protein Ais01nite_56420 [Asanoa ishikariensis]SDZ54572.1 hypothetical protein SAMN05421684_6504 [Asanoa ishikariensis]
MNPRDLGTASRMTPRELVHGVSAEERPVKGFLLRCLAAGGAFVVMVLVFSWLDAWALAVAIPVGALVLWRSDGIRLCDFADELMASAQVELSASPAKATSVLAETVRAWDWVCPGSDHAKEQAPEPSLTFRKVQAVWPDVEAGRLEVAFTDGTSRSFAPDDGMRRLERPPLPVRSPGEGDRAVAGRLEALVARVAAETSVPEGECSGDPAALRAAIANNLLERHRAALGWLRELRIAFVRLASDPAMIPERRLRGRPAAHTWLMADPRRNVGRAVTSRPPSQGVRVNNTFYINGSDLRGSAFGGLHNSVPGTDPQEDLKALRAVLEILDRLRHELPQDLATAQRLAAAEATVRHTVDTDGTVDAQTKSALGVLLSVAGQLVIGAAGNGLYDFVSALAS